MGSRRRSRSPSGSRRQLEGVLVHEVEQHARAHPAQQLVRVAALTGEPRQRLEGLLQHQVQHRRAAGGMVEVVLGGLTRLDARPVVGVDSQLAASGSPDARDVQQFEVHVRKIGVRRNVERAEGPLPRGVVLAEHAVEKPADRQTRAADGQRHVEGVAQLHVAKGYAQQHGAGGVGRLGRSAGGRAGVEPLAVLWSVASAHRGGPAGAQSAAGRRRSRARRRSLCCRRGWMTPSYCGRRCRWS